VKRQQPCDEAKTKAIVAEHVAMEGPVLPILQTMQATLGCVARLMVEKTVAVATGMTLIALARADDHTAFVGGAGIGDS